MSRMSDIDAILREAIDSSPENIISVDVADLLALLDRIDIIRSVSKAAVRYGTESDYQYAVKVLTILDGTTQ